MASHRAIRANAPPASVLWLAGLVLGLGFRRARTTRSDRPGSAGLLGLIVTTKLAVADHV
jgi:hypothetical protein